MVDFVIPEGLTDVKPIREIICEHLRQSIIDGVIKPGERMVERDIAFRYKASRTPVREALQKLESEGLAEYLPRKGMVVKGFDIREIEEIYNVRKTLESVAVRSAIEHITPALIKELMLIIAGLEQEANGSAPQTTFKGLRDFDDLILRAAKLPRILEGFLRTLQETLQRYRKSNLADQPRRRSAIREHKEILQALIDKDVAKAEKMVCQHIDNSRDQLLRQGKK